MRWLIQTALRLRVAVVAVSALFIVVGLQTVRTAPFDVFPEFAPPLVEVQTEAPGLSSDEVEALVTVPLENALIGTPFVRTVRSKSVLGLSSVVMFFARGTDLFQVRQFVAERLARVGPSLPAAARPPVLLSPLSSMSRILKIGLSSTTLSQTELTTLGRWTVRPRLMAVPGVANVAIWGQRDRQLQVQVDPDRLRANHVTLAAVVRATGDAVAVGAGGYVDTPQQRLAVSQRVGILTSEELARAPLTTRNGAAVALGDVADVRDGNPPPIGDAVIDDGPGLLLIVEKQPWGNTLLITRGVDAALSSLAPALPGVKVDATIFRPASFIEMALSNLTKALMIGCVLVIAVLILFLRDWRSAAISLTAIPLSLIAAAVAMRYRGGTLDTMVLAGLAMALGEVVDDAIISVENIERRLRLNRLSAAPRSAFKVVLEASIEVRSAVLYASLIVALIFVPVFFLGGVSGAFFRPLALSYVLAILASLAVALIVTPALSLLLIPRRDARTGDAPFAAWLKTRYVRALPAFVDRPRAVLQGLIATFAVTALVVPLLGQEFLPRFKEYDFLMHWVEKPGTSLDAMRRITILASRELRSIPGVRNFGAHLGRAEVADEVVGPNFTELWISIDPKVDYDGTVSRVQSVVDGYPGLYRDLLTYLRERIKEVLTGASATIVVRVFGDDLGTLRREAIAISGAMTGIPGLADLKVQPQVLVPQIEVRLRTDALQRVGLSPGDVRRHVATIVQGTKVGEVYDQQKIFDVVVWGVPDLRTDPAAIRSLALELPGGGTIPLGDVADVRMVPTPNEITREAASRRLDVTANVRGRSLSGVARAVERAVGGVSMPTGYHAEVLGEYAAQRESSRRLLALGGLALFGIVLILLVDFREPRNAAIVFGSLPLALIGGVGAVLLSGGVLSLGSIVGFVTVLGIAARNGIMLVSHFRHMERYEGVSFGRELVLRGAEERLVPIAMTATVTALALLPLVVGGSRPGHEIEHPMAIVIVGGLVSSTLLNLFLVPSIYLRYGRPTPADEEEE